MNPTIPVYLHPEDCDFPDPKLALNKPNGLLAIGGNLSCKCLLNAYKHGIFPWYSYGQPILWWSPDPRCILYLDELKISRSLHKTMNKADYSLSYDKAFTNVIRACSEPRTTSNETWITPEIITAYCQLHKQGHAHSIEVWRDEKLVGGLYGVYVNKVFSGESMFSREPDTSKMALIYLAQFLQQQKAKLIDCQIPSSHLIRLGARCISRKQFLEILTGI